MAFSPLALLKLNRWRGNEPAVDPLVAQAKRDAFVEDIINLSQLEGVRAALDYYHEEVQSERQEYTREYEIRDALRSIHPRSVDDLDAMIESLDVDVVKYSQRSHMIFQETLIQAQRVPEAHPALAWARMFVKHKPQACAQTFLSGNWPSLWIGGWEGGQQGRELTKTTNNGLLEVVRTCWEMAMDEYTPTNSICGEDGVWKRYPVQDKETKRDPLPEICLVGLVDVWARLQRAGWEPEINDERLGKLKCAIEEHPHFVYQTESQKNLEMIKVAVRRRSLGMLAQRHSGDVDKENEQRPTTRKPKF